MKRGVWLFFICVLVAAAADVTGKWDVTVQTSNGREIKLEMALSQSSGKLAGTLSSPQGTVELQEVQLQGDQLSYKVPVGENTYAVKGTVAGDSIKGSVSGGSDGSTSTMTATRAAAAAPAASNGNGLLGKWKVVSKSSAGQEYYLTLELKEADGKTTGTLTTDDGNSLPLQDVKLEEKAVSFKLNTGDNDYTVKLAAEGEGLKGTYSSANGESGSVTATR